jgi:chitin synthase
MNFVFAAKHMNKGKIDSHFYFFRGFCEMMNPEYCLMLDIGTEPLHDSVTKLVSVLDAMPHIGGVCGDMDIDLPPTEERSMFHYA